MHTTGGRGEGVGVARSQVGSFPGEKQKGRAWLNGHIAHTSKCVRAEFPTRQTGLDGFLTHIKKESNNGTAKI